MKLSDFTFHGGRDHKTTIFSHLNTVLWNSTAEKIHQHLTTWTWNIRAMNFETAWIHFIRDAFGATDLVVVTFKLPIVNRVDARKICLLTFVSLKASEMAYHDNVKYFYLKAFLPKEGRWKLCVTKSSVWWRTRLLKRSDIKHNIELCWRKFGHQRWRILLSGG